MEQVSVRLPSELHSLISDKADNLGIKKSEKIRSDLLQIYGDEIENEQ